MTFQTPEREFSTPAKWVQLTRYQTGLPNLVCFHFAGGSAQSFQKWKDTFAGVANLLAPELPGRGRRHKEPFVTSIQEAAFDIVQGWEIDDTPPVIFCGHSLGALLAFETAHECARQRQECAQQGIGAGRHISPRPSRLVLMARQAPTIKASRTNLPEPTREGLRRYLSKLNGTPAAVLNDDSFMDLMIPILRADFELLRTYRWNNHTQLDVPIQIIGASQDEIIDFQSLLPWSEATTGDFAMSMIDGGHFSPMVNPSFIRSALFS